MKTLKEALISKNKRNWATIGNKFVVLVPDEGFDDIFIEDFKDTIVYSEDGVPTSIVSIKNLKSYKNSIQNINRYLILVPKKVYSLDQLVKIIRNIGMYDGLWTDFFDEMTFDNL